jgi:hypothetical protein
LETLFCVLYCMADFDFPGMCSWNREFLVKVPSYLRANFNSL